MSDEAADIMSRENGDAKKEDGSGAVPGLDSRKAALELLAAVADRKQPLDQALGKCGAFQSLPDRDRAFCRMLITTALRRWGQIDGLISRALDRDEPPRPAQLLHILRLGTVQLVFMDVPDHAAVDLSVRLAKQAGLSGRTGLVNAVLRRLSTDGPGWCAAQDAPRLNAPEWLLRQWIADYGLKTAIAIAEANLAEAPLDISLKNPELAEMWAGALEAIRLPTGTLRRAGGGGRIEYLKGYDEGQWWVQDAAAALPARLFGDIAGKEVLDLCAAPGGKTAQLAAMGAHVTALDRSARRLARLTDNMRRLQLEEHIRSITADAAHWQAPAPVEYILLDAPCTSTGTLRRNPDAALLKGPEDQRRLMDIQARLLANAAGMLRSGGILIYCTCSLQKDEGERQIEHFLTAHRDFGIVPVAADEIGGLEPLIAPEGTVRALPFHLAPKGGLDGFFIARMQKA